MHPPLGSSISQASAREAARSPQAFAWPPAWGRAGLCGASITVSLREQHTLGFKEMFSNPETSPNHTTPWLLHIPMPCQPAILELEEINKGKTPFTVCLFHSHYFCAAIFGCFLKMDSSALGNLPSAFPALLHLYTVGQLRYVGPPRQA